MSVVILILMLLFLAALLAKDTNCPEEEENNYKLIALAGAIVVLVAAVAPEGVCAAICVGIIASMLFVHLEMDFEVEEFLIARISMRLFGKEYPSEPSPGAGDEAFNKWGRMRQQCIQRERAILNGCSTLVVLLGIAALVTSLIQTISSFGWWFILVVPVASFVMMLAMMCLYVWLYQSDDVTK